MVSGNGQVIPEQTSTAAYAPFLVRARGPSGAPQPGIAVVWSISQGQGTLIGKVETTGENGFATAGFVSTTLQPGISFQPATVTASSSFGTVNFVITTAGGGFTAIPLVELIAPPLDNRNLSGQAGSTIPDAVGVRVVAVKGIQSGQGIPNVGMRIVNADDPTSPPVASCSGPGGMVLTDQTGEARCDLILGSVAGVTRIAAHVGEFRYTPAVNLEITPGAACTFTLSPTAQSISAGGGSGNFTVTAPAGCTWTATSNASWVSLTSSGGTGNGTVAYAAAANTGPARSGTLTVGGQTFTISQPPGTTGPTPLSISTSAALPGGRVGTPFSAALQATGGTPPYNWSLTGSVPPGTGLNAASGILSGTPTAAGTYSFTATARDTANASASRAFTLTVSPANPGGGTPGSLSIVNSSLPNGTPGQAYQQALSSAGGCSNPFGPIPVFTLASGTLPPGLTIGLIGNSAYGIIGTPTTNGVYSFVVRVTDSCQNAATGNFSITIGAGGGALPIAVSPGSLTFTVTQGSATAPEPRQLNITSASAAAFTTSASVNWLSVPSGGTTPANVAVSVVNYSALTPGTHQGLVTITPQTGGAAVTVQVALNVTSAVSLGIEPGTINFTVNGAGTFNRELVVTNLAAVQFSAAASTLTGGNWLSVNPGTGSTTTRLSVAVNTNGLQPQSYLGFVTITPAGGNPQQIPVSLDVMRPAALTASSADVKFTSDLGAVPAEQTIAVASTGSPLNFQTSVQGPFTVTPSSGVTPATLRVVANPQGLAAGSHVGAITLTVQGQNPQPPPVTIAVTLTMTQSGPTITAVTNAASFLAGPIAPGEFVTIFGSNLGPGTLAISQPTAAGFIPDAVGETRVWFDGIPAPVIYSLSSQVSVIVPYAMTGRTSARVEVEHSGVRSNAVDVPVGASAPGIFTTNQNGQGAILNQDTSVNSVTNGAEPGSIVSIYATGEGATDPINQDGRIIGDALAKPSLPVKVFINGEETDVLYAGSAPGMAAGVIQVNARVPASAPRGAFIDVRLRVGSADSQPGVKLATKP